MKLLLLPSASTFDCFLFLPKNGFMFPCSVRYFFFVFLFPKTRGRRSPMACIPINLYNMAATLNPIVVKRIVLDAQGQICTMLWAWIWVWFQNFVSIFILYLLFEGCPIHPHNEISADCIDIIKCPPNPNSWQNSNNFVTYEEQDTLWCLLWCTLHLIMSA